MTSPAILRRAVLALVGALAACTAPDPRVDAELAANERWTAIQAAVETRRGLSRELGSIARARPSSGELGLALQAVDEARMRTADMPMSRDDLADPLKAAAWLEAQRELARARRELARDVGAAELEGRLAVADQAFAAALQQYDAAAAAYSETLARAGRDANPLTGRRFLPRAPFNEPAPQD